MSRSIKKCFAVMLALVVFVSGMSNMSLSTLADDTIQETTAISEETTDTKENKTPAKEDATPAKEDATPASVLWIAILWKMYIRYSPRWQWMRRVRFR